MTIDPVRFGMHDAMLHSLDQRLESVEEYVHSMNGKLDTIQLTLAERKGERRVGGWISGTAAGALVSLLIAYITDHLKR